MERINSKQLAAIRAKLAEIEEKVKQLESTDNTELAIKLLDGISVRGAGIVGRADDLSKLLRGRHKST